MGATIAVMAAADVAVREVGLFAAIGFLVGGIDDLLIDLVFLVTRLHRTTRPGALPGSLDLDRLPQPRRYAIFVPAWDEAPVIGAMLRNALAVLDHPQYRLYVGAYRNDPATIAAVAAAAPGDGRVRLVIVPHDGPTTKADCLNTLWRTLLADDAAAQTVTEAIVLHDAEDLVDALELRVFDGLIDRCQAIQLPVLPLPHPRSRWISGHYLDEFAQAHGGTLVVRQALGAGLPLAGVGCALRIDALAQIARRRGGDPFDAASLTEDYELGLTIAAQGGRGWFARQRDTAGRLIVVRAFFPDTLDAAVRQKARWMTGIALAGWDRVGWSRPGDWRDHWMRIRDRRAPLAMLVLAAAYAALVGWAVLALLHWCLAISAPPLGAAVRVVLLTNGLLLLWRLAARALWTGRAYGWRQALWAVPRAFVSNVVALLAARRAVVRYVGMLRGKQMVWDKTAHIFPGVEETAA